MSEPSRGRILRRRQRRLAGRGLALAWALALTVPTLVLAGSPERGTTGAEAPASPAPAASPARLGEDIGFLAADALAGRDSGRPGLEVAAEYLAARFEELGLEPAGDRGTFFHHFAASRGARFLENDRVALSLEDGPDMTWRGGADVEAFGYAAPEDGALPLVDAPLVFAGYGITVQDGEAKEPSYDDYAGLDVSGKVVLLLRFTPRWSTGDPAFGGRRGPHAPFVAKLRNAREHGAAGVVFVTPPGADEEPPAGLAWHAAPRSPTLPAVVARRDVVDRLLRLRGNDLASLVEAIDADLRPRSFALDGVRVRFATGRRLVRLRNVVARLPGRDLAGESVVVGGHYDHIGRWGNQVAPGNLGEIHNGADDNASGTAGMLEVARVLAAGEPPRRSVLFLAFSGEEIGLLGSRAWVEAPRWFRVRETAVLRPQPHAAGSGEDGARLAPGELLRAKGDFRGALLEAVDQRGRTGWVDASRLEHVAGPPPVHSVVAMLNLDMIGRAKAGGSVSVLGAASSPQFPELVRRVAEDHDLAARVAGSGGFGGGSDHMHFQRHGIPVLFFHTGITGTYNSPEDDPGTLNLEMQARICNVVASLARGLATREARPEFDPSSLARRGHGRPMLGVQIDADGAEAGARVASVLEKSVAGKAGLRDGDVIVRFAGQEVADVLALRRAIQEHGRGDVAIVVRRDGTETELTASFPDPERGGFRVRFGSVPDYAFAERGVRFEDIRSDTPASRAGVEAGDVLLRWDGTEVEGVEHWTRLLGEHEPGDQVSIRIRRDGEVLDLEVTLEAR